MDITIALAFYLVTGFGVTVGLHRYFTHGAFKAKRWLRITLAVAGSLAIEGPLITMVADHRRHHAYADREGDDGIASGNQDHQSRIGMAVSHRDCA